MFLNCAAAGIKVFICMLYILHTLSAHALHRTHTGLMQHSGESMSGQLCMTEAEVQRRLLAQIGSRGLLQPRHRFDSSSLGNAPSGQGTAASPCMQSPLRTQQQQHAVTEMVSHLLHHLDAAVSVC